MSQAGIWRKTASGAGKNRGSPRKVKPFPEERLWASLRVEELVTEDRGRHVRAGLEPVVAEGGEIDESEHDSRLREPTRLRNELQLEACRGLCRSTLSLERAHAVWSAGAGAAGSCSGAAEQPEWPGTKRGTPAFTLTGLSRTKPRSFERTPVTHGPCEQTGKWTVVEP